MFAFSKSMGPWQGESTPIFLNPNPSDPLICFDTKDTGSVVMVCCRSGAFILASKSYELLHHVFEPNIRACFHTDNGFIVISDRLIHVSVEGATLVLREERPWSSFSTETAV